MPQGTDLIVIAFGLPIFGLGVYLWGVAAINMHGTLQNYTTGKQWGKYLPISIFMPSFFTHVGNQHRKKMLRFSSYFIIYWGVLFGGGFLLKSVMSANS